MRGKATNGNRIVTLVTAMLIMGLVAGMTTSASAGAGGPTATAAKKKCKRNKKGKCIKKKKAPAPVPPAVQPAVLTMSPTAHDYPNHVNVGTGAACGDCPTQTFTVTNTGGSTSTAPSASITEVTQPVIGAHGPGYFMTANTCTAALAPGGTCAVTVKFAPPSNAGDSVYTSVLHVVAVSGGDAQASLSGRVNGP